MAVGSGAAGVAWAAPLFPQAFEINGSGTFTHSFLSDREAGGADLADPAIAGPKF